MNVLIKYSFAERATPHQSNATGALNAVEDLPPVYSLAVKNARNQDPPPPYSLL